MNKLYFDWSTYDFLFRDTDETWVQGDNDAKSVAIYFGSGETLETFVNALTASTVYDYTVTVVVTRPDDEESPSLTTSAQSGGYYKLLIDDWITAAAGSVLFEPQVKTATTTANFTAGSIVVQEGTSGSGTTISETELTALQESNAEKLKASARGYYFTSELGLTDSGTYTTEELLSACYDALTYSGGDFEFDGIARVTIDNSLTISDLPSGLLEVVINIVTRNVDGEAANVSFITGTKYTQTSSFPAAGYTDFYVYSHIFAGWTVYARKDYVDEEIASAIAALQEDITDGTITAYKAARDGSGNVITETYTPLARTIIGLALSSDISLSAFKTALGNATTSLDGLMSSTDKTRLDALYALLGESADADSVVNTINEVLAIFSEYPEGVDMVTALAAKAALAGGNDFTGTQTVTQSGAVYSNSGSVETMTDNSLTYRIYRTANALSIQEYTGGAWVTKYYVSKDGAFYASGLTPTDPVGYSHLISKEEADSLIETESTARESADNEIRQDLASTQIELNALSEAVAKSSNGDDTASVYGSDIASLGKDVARAPLKVTVDGGVLEATQLVTNPDFTTDYTGWAAVTIGTPVVSGGIISFTATATSGRLQQTFTNVANTKYYFGARVKATSNQVQAYIIGNNMVSVSHSGSGNFELLSAVGTLTTSTSTAYFRVIDNNTSGWSIIYVDYFYAFNIDKLVSAKQFSPLYATTFDLMSDAEIKAQMDYWVLNGTLPDSNLLSVGGNKRYKAVGKNLFAKGNYTYTDGYVIDGSGNVVANAGSYVLNEYFAVKPSTAYVFSTSVATTFRVAQYDINKVFISRSTGVTVTYLAFTTASNCYYVRLSSEIAQKDSSVQLELGSSATTYEPYVSTELFLQSNAQLYRVPNGTKDTLEQRNGKWYRVQRVNTTSVVGVVAVNVTNYPLAKTGGSFINYLTSGGTDVGTIGTDSTTGDGFLIYELATPVETEITSFGSILGYSSGTVYVDDSILDIDDYSTKIDITNTSYPITSLLYAIKVGSPNVELAVSSAVIAGDGLSFTHPSLSAGDIVRFAYLSGDNVMGLTTVTYYDSKFVAVDSVTSTVYKWEVTVANGTPTITLTAI